MTATDWFRNQEWNAEIEKDFLAKLARSRTQSDQYLVIQALTICKTYPNVGLQLVERYFETKQGDFEDARALSARAYAYIALEDLASCVMTMKSILAIERERPLHKTTMYVDYPYLVAAKGLESEYQSALATLQERHADLIFPLDIFKWHAAFSFISAALKDKLNAKKHAGLALDAAQIKKSGFRFHQTLGLVGSEHQATVSKLRGIYA
ncbi:hypothetical protein AEP_00394 [Curvibacter sp. AEP1-3]|uniref:hypothetical protein n=1 Tax=Curvibacter sp. AEP1-3 TaxID=1844971 RepID=UPI000B3CC7FB|nr:hypothetical protein [Curvibacter sp. AEP1-3]ARV17356.1 hypothetical protein AEP_00394 [Curvibacter sp. AEP1-3]